MFKRLLKYSGNRNFSQSRIWRNIEKVKPNEPPQAQTSNSAAYPKIDYKMTEFEKNILVWSGKFKSKDDIPNRVSSGTLEDAKSRLRIRVSNFMMVATLVLCGYFIWKGKTKAREGYNINKLHAEKYGLKGTDN